MAGLEQDITAAKTEWATEKAKEVNAQADKLLNEVIEGFVDLTNKAAELQKTRREIRSLANEYRAPILSRAAQDDIGFIFTNLQNTNDQLKRLDPEIRDRLPRLIG